MNPLCEKCSLFHSAERECPYDLLRAAIPPPIEISADEDRVLRWLASTGDHYTLGHLISLFSKLRGGGAL